MSSTDPVRVLVIGDPYMPSSAYAEPLARGAGYLTAQETFDDTHSFHGVAGLPFLKQHLAG